MRRYGPGFLVAAAFIGPGTVTTASVAGATYGYALVWVVVCAIGATVILQEMAARLGAAAGLGLGEALRTSFRQPAVRTVAVGLALLAITFGNAAYQGGNLTGAALGLEALTGGARGGWIATCAIAAAALLFTGAYRVVETVLIGLVAVMGLVFVVTAFLVGPDLAALAAASFPPRIPAGGGLLLLALIGTTVVPYNLFLHAAAVREKWGGRPTLEAAREARRDTVVAVLVGGLVTMAVLLSALPLYLAGIAPDGVQAMALQLEPLLGPHGRILFAVGLFAAGLTSAVTAPLAAAWATAGLLGWPVDMRDTRFRAVWGGIIAVGAAVALAGVRPVEAIVLAQAANGLLLPLIAGFLLWVMNRPDTVGAARNGWVANLLGGAVVTFSVVLSISTLYRVILA